VISLLKKVETDLLQQNYFFAGIKHVVLLLGQVFDLVLEREGVPIITLCFSQLC
jgi:hypothetical protein